MEEHKSIQIANAYLHEFLEGYKFVVNERYFYQYQSNPEAFPFMKKENYRCSIVLLNEKFFEYSKVIIFTNDINIKHEYNLQKEDSSALSKNYTNYIYNADDYVREQTNIIDDDNFIYYVSIFHDEYPFKETREFILDSYNQDGKRFAEKQYQKYFEASNEKMSDKSHKTASPFNHLNLDDMKRIVHDDTFDYQINQGLEAYKRELYLPAAATFAVAIETFLIKLKRANNIKHKNSDSSMYSKLLEDLGKNNKLNYRTKKRIEVAYSMRNIVNHTQAGAVAKADCDFLLNTLKDLVDNNQETIAEYNKSIDDSK